MVDTAKKTYLRVWDGRSKLTLTPVVVDEKDEEVTKGQAMEVTLDELKEWLGSDKPDNGGEGGSDDEGEGG